jgi:hypothetical protein
MLANLVREWVEEVDPGDEPTARAAVSTALAYFSGGASVSEAGEEARHTVLCRLRHPSHGPLRYAGTSSGDPSGTELIRVT